MLSVWNSVPLGSDLFGQLMLSQILSIFLSFYFSRSCEMNEEGFSPTCMAQQWTLTDFSVIGWIYIIYVHICAEWWGLARGPPGASQPCHLLATLYLLENDKIPELAQFWGFPFSGKHLSLCACLKMMKSLNLVNFGISHFLANTNLPAFIVSASTCFVKHAFVCHPCLASCTLSSKGHLGKQCLPRSLWRRSFPNWRTLLNKLPMPMVFVPFIHLINILHASTFHQFWCVLQSHMRRISSMESSTKIPTTELQGYLLQV